MRSAIDEATSRLDAFINAASEPTDWPELIPFSSTAKLPGMNPANLPTWAGQFATELATETETPPDLAVGLTL
ncbi:MAG TPA: hypothetical protein PLD29_10055, partial [Halothiobacillus sp.]|nr:hypothetical protein [Halothiobacillus sp.]